MSETPTTNPGIPEITFLVNLADSVPVPVDDTLSIPGQAADAAAVGAAMEQVAQDASTALSTAVTALENAIAALFPVGCIYTTTSSSAPAFFGTWVEVMIPATWDDIMNGARDAVNKAEGDTPGTLHFWKRTA